MRGCLCMGLALCLCAGTAFSEPPVPAGWFSASTGRPASELSNPNAGYFGDKERGWFWYEQYPVQEDTPEPAPAKPIQQAGVKPPQPKPEEPAPLSAEWMRINMGKYRDKAVDDPTKDNVTDKPDVNTNDLSAAVINDLLKDRRTDRKWKLVKRGLLVCFSVMVGLLSLSESGLSFAPRSDRLALSLALSAMPGLPRADMNAELRGAFDGMVNATGAQAYSTQRRGVITGGSIAIRSNMTNPNLMSFAPPSFKAGCNGIDFFGGSFSYINGAQFNQMLRNIAQAAAGYAFQLAIEGMCPTCGAVMNNLQKIMQTLNGVMKNSCEAGKAIVNATAGPEIKEWGKYIGDETSSSVNTAAGVTNDWFANLNAALSPSQALAQSGKAMAVSANVAKKAMDNADITAWYAHGDDKLAMVLLSLTGSLIAGPNKDNTDLAFSSPPAIISVKDFIEGGNVSIYQCPDADCLALDPKVNVQPYQMVGMRQLVRDMLFGTCVCDTGTGGIIRKMANRGEKTTFTPQEQAFIQSSNPGVLGLVNRIGTDFQAAAMVADKMVDVVAVENAHSIAAEMFGSMKAALKASGSDVPMTNTMVDNIEKVQLGIAEQRKTAAESIAGVGVLIDMHKNVRENLNSRSSVATGFN